VSEHAAGENQLTRNTSRKWHKPRIPVTRQSDLNRFTRLLDAFLAFDRVVVEINMAIYNVPQRDQVLVRRHNHRLHETLRTRLPQVVEPSLT